MRWRECVKREFRVLYNRYFVIVIPYRYSIIITFIYNHFVILKLRHLFVFRNTRYYSTKYLKYGKKLKFDSEVNFNLIVIFRFLELSKEVQ